MRPTTKSTAKPSQILITDDPLYSVPEACRLLGGISKWTLFAWLTKGRLQRTKVGGRTMIRRSELQRMIQDGSQKEV
jgi:excisionase family DNA binding protein